MIRTPPIWASALPPPFPKFEGSTLRCDTAIIGGGFAGLSAAYHLLKRRPGASVVVLEASHIGAGASGATTGMLTPGVGQDLPGLVKRLGAVTARGLYLATLRAVRDVERLVREAALDCELAMCGQLVVSGMGREKGDRHLFGAPALIDRRLLREEKPVPFFWPRRLRRLAATMSALELPHQVRSDGLRLPVAGTLHPGKLLKSLTERVTQLGGTIFEGARVRSVSTTAPVRLELEHGEVVAGDVVVATAGFTPGLGVLHGRVLPVHLQVLVTDPVKPWPGREGVVDARRLFSYWRLTSDDRLVFGGGRPQYRWGGSTIDRGPDPALARELERVCPGARIAGSWGGVIGYVADALPAIHRWSRNPAVVHAVGWCGHGVALSLASGDWVARIIDEGAAPEDLPWFRAEPPRVPFELARWLGFRAAVGAMSLLDHLEAA